MHMHSPIIKSVIVRVPNVPVSGGSSVSVSVSSHHVVFKVGQRYDLHVFVVHDSSCHRAPVGLRIQPHEDDSLGVAPVHNESPPSVMVVVNDGSSTILGIGHIF